MKDYLIEKTSIYLSQIEKELIKDCKFIVYYKINLPYSKVEYKISDGTVIEVAIENILKENK